MCSLPFFAFSRFAVLNEISSGYFLHFYFGRRLGGVESGGFLDKERLENFRVPLMTRQVRDKGFDEIAMVVFGSGGRMHISDAAP